MKSALLILSAILLSASVFASNSTVTEKSDAHFIRTEDSPAGELQVGGEIARYMFQEMNVRDVRENDAMVKKGRNVNCMKFSQDTYSCTMMVEMKPGEVYSE